MDNQIFRQKSLDQISSPEQLHDYLRVPNPTILDAALKQQVGPCLGRGGVAAENGNANGIFPDTGLKRCRIPHGDTAGTSGCGALDIQLGQELEVVFRTAVVNQHVDHQRIIAQKKNTVTPVQPEGRFDLCDQVTRDASSCMERAILRYSDIR